MRSWRPIIGGMRDRNSFPRFVVVREKIEGRPNGRPSLLDKEVGGRQGERGRLRGARQGGRGSASSASLLRLSPQCCDGVLNWWGGGTCFPKEYVILKYEICPI